MAHTCGNGSPLPEGPPFVMPCQVGFLQSYWRATYRASSLAAGDLANTAVPVRSVNMRQHCEVFSANRLFLADEQCGQAGQFMGNAVRFSTATLKHSTGCSV